MARQSTYRPLTITASLTLCLSPCPVAAFGQTRGSTTAERSTTAEELLEALRKHRPTNEVILPESASQMGQNAPKLLPEGTAVVDRAGSVTRDGAWWVFTSADNADPIRLLPNLMLEAIVRMVETAETSLQFAVSGDLMLFEGANYLLVRSSPRAKVPVGEAKDPKIEVDAQPGSGSAQKHSTGTEPASDDNAADVLDVLRGQDRERPIFQVPAAGIHGEEARVASVVAGLLDGSALVARPGRVARQGSWWVLVFESDHRDSPEPPMRLLPCSGTERMIRTSADHTGGVVFTVSGEVTSFFGHNYLLARAVTRRVASGNLRK